MTAVSQASDIASDADYDHCRQIMRSASKNYSFASSFLPKDRLHHVEALYAFLRVGDDRVDVSHAGFSSALDAIADWEELYWDAFKTGGSPDPVMRAYLDTAIKFNIPAEVMAAYFRAMREDLTITRFPTFNHLLHYMEGSAMTVGRAMTYIMGVREPFHFEEALTRADSLSVAMQLSNFWRDIGYDWSIGRVYIPLEDMRRFKVTEADIASGQVTENLVALLEHQIERTHSYYEHAREGVHMLSNGRWGVMSGLEIYRAIITTIPKNGYDVFNIRSGAGKAGKFALLAKAWWEIRSPHRLSALTQEN